MTMTEQPSKEVDDPRGAYMTPLPRPKLQADVAKARANESKKRWYYRNRESQIERQKAYNRRKKEELQINKDQQVRIIESIETENGTIINIISNNDE